MPYRCREKACGKKFSLRTGNITESSKLGYQAWDIAIYLLSTSLKGVSGMKLHRDLNITQKSTWYLAHRIRKSLASEYGMCKGPIEVDETYIGGKEANEHGKQEAEGSGVPPLARRLWLVPRIGILVRYGAAVISDTKTDTLQGFVADNTDPEAEVYMTMPQHTVTCLLAMLP